MTTGLPPNPKMFRNLQQWAEQLYEFYLADTRIDMSNDPMPVLLSSLQTGDERAAQDGILMYDPIDNTVKVSYSGKWVSIGYAPSFTAAEIADATDAVNTDGKVAGKIIYDSTNNTLAVANGANATSTWSRLTVAATVTPA